MNVAAAPTKPRPAFADAVTVLAASPFGYQQRPGQTAMAEAVQALMWAPAVEEGQMPPALMANAPCGTGKSFAFAIPAAQCGQRVVVATATIALQEQLIKKDLPFLAETLPDFPAYAILKGRANYACLAKIDEAPKVAALAELKAELAAPEAVGDRDSITTVLTGEEWRAVSATPAECPGARSCPFAQDCFAEKAKAVAAQAKIVVTNFAMLGVDMALRQASDGAASMLGRYDILVCDEADGLDAALRNALTKTMTLRGLQNLAANAQSFARAHGPADKRGEDLSESLTLIAALHALGAVLPQIPDPDQPQAAPAGDVLTFKWFADNEGPVADLIAALDALGVRIDRVATDGPKEKVRQKMLLGQAENACDALRAAFQTDEDAMVRYNTWFKHPNSPDLAWSLDFCPVDISGICREQLWSRQPTVLTSATLTTGPGDFTFFARTMGLDHADRLDVPSPFDFQNQALLYTPVPRTAAAPHGAPHPTSERQDWLEYVARTSLELVQAAGGGALLLFTSRSAMTAAHAAMAPELRRDGYTVLIQDGETSRTELARIFREDADSVLFGLKSFFVGLDVPGDALRLVVIDKLPFPVPTEYVMAARCKAERKAGRLPFTSLFVPMMILDLVQGFGRLIRTVADRGVVAILDQRLTGSGYGSDIVAGLPDCPAAVDLDEVRKFFSNA